MSDSLLLQIFLLFNVFIIGALTSIAVRHAYAHFKPAEPEAPKHPKEPASQQGGHIPPALREKLLQASQAHFQSVLNKSADELQQDLKTTATQLNNHMAKLGSDIVAEEMKRYHASLEALRKQTETTISGAQSEIANHQLDIKNKLAEHQAQLEAKLAADIAAEKEQLVQKIDSKLSDAVASFLTETLQHNVDLGAQEKYLISMLEEHKAELIKEVRDEA